MDLMTTPESLPGERWLPVVGYEDRYLVSDLGRVYSVRRYRAAGKFLKPGTAGSSSDKAQRYLYFNAMRDGVTVKVFIHRAVLAAFVGPNPGGLEVLHWDDDAQNNRLGNLRYGTRSDNQRDRVRNGINPNASRTECVHGHEFTAANTYRYGRRRVCKTCIFDRQRARRRSQPLQKVG